MTPVIWYQSEGYRTDVPKLMGRLAAGAGFLKGFAQHSRAERFVGLVRGPRERDEFVETMRAIRPDVPAVTIPLARIREVSQYGVLSYPAPIDARLAIARNFYGARSFSLSGVTHTISSSGIMDVVTRWLTTPMQPWDAVVCTSRAVVDAVEHMLEAEKEMLRERLGAQRFILPRLPVIPLGVDCDAQAVSAETRGKARSALSIAPDDLVVLFVGRLSFHAKANPAPMYLALERLAARRRVVLIECGWTANDHIRDSLAAACTALCPSVRSIVLDGREAANRAQAWGAADIFCSLSDNIQETFGLTPIEAMAAGLPSIVSDWNGYRDTVRDGIDGFAIPTLMPPPGAGQDLAIAHAVESDNYDAYIGRAALSIVVDVEGTAAAFERLAGDPDLRRKMGESAARRAREAFDWKVVVGAYEDLWSELDAERRSARDKDPPSKLRSWPSRLDPFTLFKGYPTHALDPTQTIRLTPAASSAAFETRLGLNIASYATSEGFTMERLTALRDALRGKGMTVAELLKRLAPAQQAPTIRALLLLAKFGLVEIGPAAGRAAPSPAAPSPAE